MTASSSVYDASGGLADLVTSVEVPEEAIARIERVNPALHAVVERMCEAARGEASCPSGRAAG